MEVYVNGNRDSWAMMLDNSTSTTFENSALSGPEQKWGLREWLISASFVVALVIILLKPTLNDEDAEDSNQESIGNEIAPVKKKRIDEEARKANILNLFLSKHNQQEITSEQIKPKSSRTIESLSITDASESYIDSNSNDEDNDSTFDLEEGSGTVVLSSISSEDDNNTEEISSDGSTTSSTSSSSSDIESNPKCVSNLCAICLEEYHEGETIVWASNKKCPHAFHRDCLVSYLVKVKTENHYPCPCCRQNFFFENSTDDECTLLVDTTSDEPR